MKRFIALVLVLLLIFAPAALAEMRNGDSGDEVAYLQRLLFETGFLFAEPDGSFGKNTEQAVKDYQKFAQLEETGVVTDDTLGKLEETWRDVMTDIYGADYLTEETDITGSIRHETVYPIYCCILNDGAGNGIIEFCERHAAVVGKCAELWESSEENASYNAWTIWKNEIMCLYDEWAEMLPEKDRVIVDSARTMFFASAEMQLRVIRAYYESLGEEEADSLANAEMADYMREHAAHLCMTINDLHDTGMGD